MVTDNPSGFPVVLLQKIQPGGGGGAELDLSAGVSVPAPVNSGNLGMAQAALQELGYSAAEINAAMKGVDPKATTEEMVRYALRQMVMKN